MMHCESSSVVLNANSNVRRSSGTVASGFEAVRAQFDMYLEADPAFGAQIAVYHRGDLVVDLVGGPGPSESSVTGVFSGTKGAAAVAVAMLVDDGSLDLDERVVLYWPEFAPYGKDRITIRELLSHQAGLVNVRGGMDFADLLIDSRAGAAALAAARPLWRPGSAVGYHGVTIGVLMEELVRRITGDSLQNLYEQRVRGPRNIDFYLGLPESEERRYRDVLPMQPTPQQLAQMRASPPAPDGYSALMLNDFNASPDLFAGQLSPNRRHVRAAGAAGAAGVASARGIAKLYAAVLGHIGMPLLSAETLGAVTQQQSWGLDRVLNVHAGYAIVFQTSHPAMDFGSYQAFGHDGAGGAIGSADPSFDLAFGYVPAALQYPGGADPKGIRLSQIARRCLTIRSTQGAIGP